MPIMLPCLTPAGELNQAAKCSTASYKVQIVRFLDQGIGVKGADCVATVDRDEVDRLRKRFMKLDKVGASPYCLFVCSPCSVYVQDNSGTIERDEFLSLPQVSSNPLATRYLTSTPMTLTAQMVPRLTTSHFVVA